MENDTQAATQPAQSADTDPKTVQPAAADPAAQDAKAESVDALPEWAQKVIRETRAENAKHRKAAKDSDEARLATERKAAEEQGKFKELYESETSKVAKLSAELDELKRVSMRNAAAKTAGLPDALAARIMGSTEEEMLADAKALAAEFRKANQTRLGTDAGAGLGKVVGDAEQQKKLAAEKFGIKLPQMR